MSKEKKGCLVSTAFTFGSGQTFDNCYVLVTSTSYQRNIEIMQHTFGDKYCAGYPYNRKTKEDLNSFRCQRIADIVDHDDVVIIKTLATHSINQINTINRH